MGSMMLAEQIARDKVKRSQKDGSMTSDNETTYDDNELDVPVRRKKSKYSSKRHNSRSVNDGYLSSQGYRNEEEADDDARSCSTYGLYEGSRIVSKKNLASRLKASQ